jgi:hypothetical protein
MQPIVITGVDEQDRTADLLVMNHLPKYKPKPSVSLLNMSMAIEDNG